MGLSDAMPSNYMNNLLCEYLHTAFSKPKTSAYRIIGTNLWKFLKAFWTKFDSALTTHIAKDIMHTII